MEWFTYLWARGVPALASLRQGDRSIWSSREPALMVSSLLQGPHRLLPRPGSQRTCCFHPWAQGVVRGPLCKGQMTACFNRFQGVVRGPLCKGQMTACFNRFQGVAVPEKTSTSTPLTMLKPLTVRITTNGGKFFKRREYQTSLPVSWETCMQVKKQQLEPDMEQWTGSKLGKEYIKPVYCCPVYLTFMQSTSWEMSG